MYFAPGYFAPILSAAVMLAFGVSSMWTNPKRPANWVLGLLSLLSVVHFAAMTMGRVEGAQYLLDHAANPLPWIRLKWSALGFMPAISWLLYYAVSMRYGSRRELLLKITPWILLSLILMAMPYSVRFIPADSMPDHRSVGPLYELFQILIVGSECIFCVASFLVARRLSGVARLEFNLIILAFGFLTVAALLFARYFYFASFLIFAVIAWGISTKRVYQSRQILLSVGQRAAVVGTIAMATVYALRFLPKLDPSVFAAGTVIGLAFLLWQACDSRLREWLNLKGDQQVEHIAKQMQAAAADELDPDRLLERFEALLTDFAQCTRVRILRREGSLYESADWSISAQLLSGSSLWIDGWITATSIVRAPYGASAALLPIFEADAVSALVCPRWTRNQPGLIIALGIRQNRLPFTDPEIRVLREVAEAVDHLHTRVRLELQARQSEQLAKIGRVGAKIVHELRNPMWTLKTFAQLLPSKFGNVEFLDKCATIIPRETERIEELAERLLTLSKPQQFHFELADLHRLVTDTATLVQPQLESVGVHCELELNASQHLISADPGAIRQVLLNLLRNASQALAAKPDQRRITIRSFDRRQTVELEVEDNGPGIAEKVKAKLFTEFHSGGKAGGLGLGLAISKDVIRAHRGTIVADLERTAGCLFRISLPTIPTKELDPAEAERQLLRPTAA